MVIGVNRSCRKGIERNLARSSFERKVSDLFVSFNDSFQDNICVIFGADCDCDLGKSAKGCHSRHGVADLWLDVPYKVVHEGPCIFVGLVGAEECVEYILSVQASVKVGSLRSKIQCRVYPVLLKFHFAVVVFQHDDEPAIEVVVDPEPVLEVGVPEYHRVILNFLDFPRHHVPKSVVAGVADGGDTLGELFHAHPVTEGVIDASTDELQLAGHELAGRLPVSGVILGHHEDVEQQEGLALPVEEGFAQHQLNIPTASLK